MLARTAFSALFLAVLACAQEPRLERIVTLHYATSPTAMQEILNVARSIGDVPDATQDREAHTLTLRATASQLDAAEWCIRELDRPADQPAPPNNEAREYRTSGTGGFVATTYFFIHIADPRSMQEVVNSVRATTEMQRLFPVSTPHALIMRGTADQVAAAKWMIAELDREAPPASAAPVVHAYPGSLPRLAAQRIFFLGNIHDPQGLQEAVNATRSVAEVQRFFPVTRTAALVLSGSLEEAEVSEWLLSHLDTAGAAAPGERPDSASGVVRVYAIPSQVSPQTLQQAVNRVRAEVQVRNVFPVHTRHAVLFRGTAEQAAAAGRIFAELH